MSDPTIEELDRNRKEAEELYCIAARTREEFLLSYTKADRACIRAARRCSDATKAYMDAIGADTVVRDSTIMDERKDVADEQG